MTTEYRRAADYLATLLSEHKIDDLAARLKPDLSPPPRRVPGGAMVSAEALNRRWEILNLPAERAELLDARTVEQVQAYKHNIENFIGAVRIPVGIAGPLRVCGLFAHGDFYVPLATTDQYKHLGPQDTLQIQLASPFRHRIQWVFWEDKTLVSQQIEDMLQQHQARRTGQS